MLAPLSLKHSVYLPSQVGVLTDEVGDALSTQARGVFGFDVAMVSVGMVASIAGALVLAAGMAAHDLIKAASVPVIKLKSTKAMPEITLAKGHIWHLFLCDHAHYRRHNSPAHTNKPCNAV